MRQNILYPQEIKKFQKTVLDYYRDNKRELAWRKPLKSGKFFDPYKIVVSEIMLQQTQVDRVNHYFPSFLKEFPHWQSLANASLRQVLKVWQGMGYNRRALYLREIALTVSRQYKNEFPKTTEELLKLPGIGKATAGAILTYTYNLPTVFIETNIRRVFIYYFFKNKKKVDDREILPLVEQTLDYKNPREWYWALMDYGTMLGKLKNNPNIRSKHYTKQSLFKGSRREMRGIVIKSLLSSPLTLKQLEKETHKEKTLLEAILGDLVKEGFIKKKKMYYNLK